MNLVFQQRMQTLYQQFIAFDALQTERTQRYRNIEPESALFLAMQIRVQQSKKFLKLVPRLDIQLYGWQMQHKKRKGRSQRLK